MTATLLLLREPSPSDPLQARPTPAPAPLGQLTCRLEAGGGRPGVDNTHTDSHTDFLALMDDLMKMPFYMLAGHLQDLDVTNVMRYICSCSYGMPLHV